MNRRKNSYVSCEASKATSPVPRIASKVLPSHANKKQKSDGKHTITALSKANAAMQK
jgi:hypothetical protein